MGKSPRFARFSVRTFLICVTIACVWWGIKANQVANQRRAVETILSVGGEVFYSHKTKWGEYVFSIEDGSPYQDDSFYKYFDDDWFFSIEGVKLFGDGCNDEVVREIADLKSVKWISLQPEAPNYLRRSRGGISTTLRPPAGITDASIETLTSLPNLESILLDANSLTPEGLLELKGCPSLKSVLMDMDGASKEMEEAYRALVRSLM